MAFLTLVLSFFSYLLFFFSPNLVVGCTLITSEDPNGMWLTAEISYKKSRGERKRAKGGWTEELQYAEYLLSLRGKTALQKLNLKNVKRQICQEKLTYFPLWKTNNIIWKVCQKQNKLVWENVHIFFKCLLLKAKSTISKSCFFLEMSDQSWVDPAFTQTVAGIGPIRSIDCRYLAPGNLKNVNCYWFATEFHSLMFLFYFLIEKIKKSTI